MKYLITITSFFSSLLLISSCANYAPANMQAKSKILTPEKDHALIYVIRPKSNGGKLFKLPLTFKYNGQKIGTLWAGQYLYFNAKPMNMVFNGENNKVVKLNIIAGNTYFLEYKATGGIGASLGGNKPLPATRIMSNNEGRALIGQYRLTGKFELVTVSQSNIKSMSPAIKTQPLAKPEIIPVIAQTKPIKSSTRRSDMPKALDDSMSYNDETKAGLVTIASGSKKKRRRKAIRMIEDLCSTKNVAIRVGSSHQNNGATYITMDESLSNGQLTVHFSCTY